MSSPSLHLHAKVPITTSSPSSLLFHWQPQSPSSRVPEVLQLAARPPAPLLIPAQGVGCKAISRSALPGHPSARQFRGMLPQTMRGNWSSPFQARVTITAWDLQASRAGRGPRGTKLVSSMLYLSLTCHHLSSLLSGCCPHFIEVQRSSSCPQLEQPRGRVQELRLPAEPPHLTSLHCSPVLPLGTGPNFFIRRQGFPLCDTLGPIF